MKYYKVRFIVWFILVLCGITLLFPTSCSPKAPMINKSLEETLRTPPEIVAQKGFDLEWQDLIKQAQKEGRVVLYTSAGAKVRQDLMEAFQKHFGITLEVVQGSGTQVTARIFAERRAGIHLVDILITGATTAVTDLKPHGLVDSLDSLLILPELTQPREIETIWWADKVPWIDKDHTALAFLRQKSTAIVINTDLVKPEEINSWYNLLEPRWEGKILMRDPLRDSAPRLMLGALADGLLNWDYVWELAKQKPVLSTDNRQMADWLSFGKYSIALSLKTETALERAAMGIPLHFITPKEGTRVTSASGNLSLINKAPHPKAARLFINWLLSKEGQTIASQAWGVPSARKDISTEGLNPAGILVPGEKYFDTNKEDWILKQPEREKLIIEIFSSLVK